MLLRALDSFFFIYGSDTGRFKEQRFHFPFSVYHWLGARCNFFNQYKLHVSQSVLNYWLYIISINIELRRIHFGKKSIFNFIHSSCIRKQIFSIYRIFYILFALTHTCIIWIYLNFYFKYFYFMFFHFRENFVLPTYSFLFDCQLSLLYLNHVSSRLYHKLLLFLHITKTCYARLWKAQRVCVCVCLVEEKETRERCRGDAIDSEFISGNIILPLSCNHPVHRVCVSRVANS